MYEYRIIRIQHSFERDQELEDILNDLGTDGWELVAVTGNNTHRGFLKRKIGEIGPHYDTAPL